MSQVTVLFALLASEQKRPSAVRPQPSKRLIAIATWNPSGMSESQKDVFYQTKPISGSSMCAVPVEISI
jgi:hypothetical protein